jgi:hypothetical protein
MARLKWLDKINVHREYNLHFFDSHKASCLRFMKIYQGKENWEILQCPPIKSPPLSYGSDHYGLMFFFIIVVLCYGALLIVFIFTLLEGFLFCLFFMYIVLEGNNIAPWFFHACCLASCCNDIVHVKSMPTSILMDFRLQQIVL